MKTIIEKEWSKFIENYPYCPSYIKIQAWNKKFAYDVHRWCKRMSKKHGACYDKLIKKYSN